MEEPEVISRGDAEKIARAFVAREFPPDEDAEDVVINDAATIERPYGWLFVYTTESYLRTGDPEDELEEAGPLLILRENGYMVEFPSYHSRESALEEYERELSRP
jgi:hypothetical protein